MKHRSAILIGLVAAVLAVSCKKKTAPEPYVPNDNPAPVVGCGDGRIDGLELCDGTVFKGGATCATYNLGTGALGCDSDCTLAFAGCATQDLCTANAWYGDALCQDCENMGGTADATCATRCGADGFCADEYNPITGAWTCQAATGAADPDCGICGNGTVEGNELCDGNAFADGKATCGDYGFVAGTLGCKADCTPIFSGCSDHLCGNGILEGSERCDGTNLGDATCESQAFFGGRLSCTTTCAFDTSSCLPFGSASYTGLYQAYCGFLVRCAAALGRMVPDQATCEAWAPTAFGNCAGVPAVSQTAVDGCTGFFSSADCAWDTSDLLTTLPGSCFEALTGITPATQGQPCVGLCAAGLVCHMTLVDNQICGVCEPYPQLDAPCGLIGNTYVSCDPALYCDGDTSTCKSKKADAAPCGGSEECRSDVCSGGYCVGGIASGSPCTVDDTCAKPFQTCVNGFCGDHLIDGSACTRSDECMMDSLCAGGVCTSYPVCTPRTAGQGCEQDDECATGMFCDTGVCATFTAPGAACVNTDECGPGAYCDRNAVPDDACAPLVPVGGSCVGGGTCVRGASCDYAGDLTCKAPRQAGESCLGGMSCVSTAFCLRVSGTESTCTAKYGVGVACTGSRECMSGVCDGTTGLCADAPTCG